jgi:hypothetical protein
MKNRNQSRYPTVEELYALERAARAARAAEMRRFLRGAVTLVKSFISTLRAKGVRHA